jgi:hypothetical protein
MPLESATYIDGLNPSNPAGTDLVSAGDDHIRLLKSAIKATFPNLAAAVTVTAAEMNMLAGVSSNIQSQLAGKSNVGHSHAETDISDGAVFARLSANETIAGIWDFTSRPTINGIGVLDATSLVPETQVLDANILARLGSNETITGSWNFTTPPLAAGLGILRWGTAGMTSGRVFLVDVVPPDTGTPGDIYLVY